MFLWVRFTAQPPKKRVENTPVGGFVAGVIVYGLGFRGVWGVCGVLSVLSVFPKVAGFSMVETWRVLRSGGVTPVPGKVGSNFGWVRAGFRVLYRLAGTVLVLAVSCVPPSTL